MKNKICIFSLSGVPQVRTLDSGLRTPNWTWTQSWHIASSSHDPVTDSVSVLAWPKCPECLG